MTIRIAGRTWTLPPLRRSALAGRIRQWRGRPSGRFALPGLLLAVILAVAAAAGAVVVPRTAPPPSATAANAERGEGAGPTRRADESGEDRADESDESGDEEAGALPSPGPPAGGLPGVQPPGGAATGRPADALSSWATGVNAKVGIPPVALAAYGYAELITAQSAPGCNLSWTTLAGIGKIESNHGQANATLQPDGKAVPTIVGLPLDGNGGRDRIQDTDTGRLDGDRTWDRAVGPMQFIPSTWEKYRVDADRDGAADPNDMDDAALAAASYLCAGGRNLTRPGDWWSAIESYNAVRVYIQDVHAAANDYGQRSR